ncbi:MAG: quinohemoprotein amine dehydrogenase subunit alpha [Acidobacteria bacterium]|nr:quinohemoprotein amine dehydrogenase subunit alpha [Acidobacteriota bacterium]
MRLLPLKSAVRRLLTGVALTLAVSAPTLAGAQPAADAADSGIPIADEAVRQACGSCHRADDQGRLSRISFRRTTPEGWQQTIRRMVILNEVAITPEVAREVVRYLANNLGLAPEEAIPAAFEAERRTDDQTYEDADVHQTCTTCHSMGRIMSQRRTGEEWQLVTAMHQGYYPFTDFQAFRRSGESDEPQPVDYAVTHLTERFPLDSPEWSAWSATMRPPRIAGTWALTGHAPGLGAVHGQVTIAAVPGTDDEFTTQTRYVYARTGRQVERTGRAVVYTGFQWRGRSFEGAADATAADPDGLREVMFVDRDWQAMRGRWFTGGYDEIGLDVALSRVGAAPLVTGVYPAAVQVGQTASLQLHGGNLAAAVAGDLDLGPGLEVLRLSSASPDLVTAEIRVGADAAVGRRDLYLGQAALADALTVYDMVSRIAVTPDAGMARVGGVRVPKQFQQFEARAFHDGPDGEAETDDDLDLGLVDVTWSVEEYATTFGDDDLRYVGAIDDQGRFTPAEDGPNVERSGNRNNVGDVWVVGTYAGSARTLRARAHLLVTVPNYLRWDPTAVERP